MRRFTQASSFEEEQTSFIQSEIFNLHQMCIDIKQSKEKKALEQMEKIKVAYANRNNNAAKQRRGSRSAASSATPRGTSSSSSGIKKETDTITTTAAASTATNVVALVSPVATAAPPVAAPVAAPAAPPPAATGAALPVAAVAPPPPPPAAAVAPIKLVESVFQDGSYGIELGGLPIAQGGGVVLVDMSPGGQAQVKWGHLLVIGMKLMRVENIDVSCFDLNTLIEIMSTTKRPVSLYWRDQPAQRIVTLRK